MVYREFAWGVDSTCAKIPMIVKQPRKRECPELESELRSADVGGRFLYVFIHLV